MELLFYLLFLDSVSSFPFPEYINNSVIKDFGIKDISKVGVIYCAIECAKRKACKTVQYHQTNLQCRLHRLTVKQAEAYKLLVVRKGHVLSELSSWALSDLKDSCIDVDCGDTRMCLLAQDGLTHVCLDIEDIQSMVNADPVSGSCAQPPEVPHASSPPVKNNVEGDVVKYTCLEGWHRTKGSARIECLSNGTWSSPEFICEKDQRKLFSFGMSGAVFEYDLTIDDPKPKSAGRGSGISAVFYNVITGTLFKSIRTGIFSEDLYNSKNRKLIKRGRMISAISVDSERNLLFYTVSLRNVFKMKYAIYVIHVDGQNNTLLNSAEVDTDDIGLDKMRKLVYFSRQGVVYQMTYRGTSITSVYSEPHIPAIFIKGDLVYILGGYRNKVVIVNGLSKKVEMLIQLKDLVLHLCGSFLVEEDTLFLVCVKQSGIHTYSLSNKTQKTLESKHDSSDIVSLAYIP